VQRLLLNPAAGRGKAAAFVDGCDGLEVIRSDGPADLEAQARRIAEAGDERLLVAGGDGTLHHAIRGLAGSETALGIIPFGSGNDFARALNVPLEPEAALRHALDSPIRRIDLGRVDGEPFACVASLGFDAEAAGVAHRTRLVRGRWLYPYAVARTLLAFRAPRLRIETEEGGFEGEAMLAAAANTPCYGGGMQIAPDARLDDGLLDLVVVERISRPRLLRLFPRVYGGSHTGYPEVRLLRVASARIHADRRLGFFADGEPLADCDGSLVEAWPRALAVAA
jgi:diacylglycerol kinase (ATP)